jgi:hypothetical protein
MTAERWQRVKQVFQSALDRAPGERSSLLARACGGDESLRKEDLAETNLANATLLWSTYGYVFCRCVHALPQHQRQQISKNSRADQDPKDVRSEAKENHQNHYGH